MGNFIDGVSVLLEGILGVSIPMVVLMWLIELL
jgi:hypothetical protein